MPRREWDEIDRQMEKEGAAVRRSFRSTGLRPKPKSKEPKGKSLIERVAATAK